MKIIIPGGSGQIGQLLSRQFSSDGHDVTILSRRLPTGTDHVGSSTSVRPATVHWNAENQGDWTNEIDGADVVINLAGRSVNCRYNTENRRAIKQSRVLSTLAIGQAIANCRNPPGLWLQASTATIYAHSFDHGNDEANGVIGGKEQNVPDTWHFSIDVAKAWEAATYEIDTPSTRRVLLRSSMTMSPDEGGVFDVLLGLVRCGLGGTNGDGRQYISWNHEQDFVNAMWWLIKNDNLQGPVNVTAPNPVPNSEFMRTLRKQWGTRIGLPATRWMLTIGAVFLRTETELILKSRRVVPSKLIESGFEFQFPDWESAAADLCQRWRDLNQRYSLKQ